MHQELGAAQKESKQNLQFVSELRVTNAGLENQVANLRRELEEVRQEAKRNSSIERPVVVDHNRLGGDDN